MSLKSPNIAILKNILRKISSDALELNKKTASINSEIYDLYPIDNPIEYSSRTNSIFFIKIFYSF